MAGKACSCDPPLIFKVKLQATLLKPTNFEFGEPPLKVGLPLGIQYGLK